MFLDKFKKQKKEKVVAVFDIGSGSVGGALVLLHENSKPKIVYETRKEIIFQKDLDFKKFEFSMLNALKLVAEELEKKGVRHPNFLQLEDKRIDNIYCFLTSPWHMTQTRNLKIEKSEGLVVNKEFIDSLVKKEREEFAEKGVKKYEKFFGKGERITILDKKIIQIKLNGYKTNNPYNKKATNIEASFFVSLAPEDLLLDIEKTIYKSFHSEKLYFHSFTLSAYTGLRDLSQKEDFVFMDVSSEVTDISFVKESVLSETQTYPIGRSSFIRSLISSGLASDYEATVSLLKMFVSDKTDDKTNTKIRDAVLEVGKKWIKSFEDSLVDLSKGIMAPQSIFLIADGDIGKILKEILETEKFTKLTLPNQDRTLQLTKIDDIGSFCDLGEGAEKDVFLCSEAYFVNKNFSQTK